MTLARAFPSLKFIVQDLPEITADGPSYLSSHPDGSTLSPRITYNPHSFFAPQPVHGAAMYILRQILHDWSTDDAVAILSQLVPALDKNSRILVMDSVLPEPGSVPLQRERLLRAQDLTMLHNFNGQDRGHEDWVELFAHVVVPVNRKQNIGLELVAVEQPIGSRLAFMELRLATTDA